MLLEIDAGNSRLKWRVSECSGQGVGVTLAQGAVPGTDPAAVIRELLGALDSTGLSGLGRILVSSVRDEGFRQECRRTLRSHFGPDVEFAVARARQHGLRSAYEQPERLGVDRWLAMLAAWVDAGTACCVVDCGTTITLDVVAADGRHCGGFIVPGLRLMHQALAQRSAALALPPAEPASSLGKATAHAITNGVFSMALGFIRDQYRLQCEQHDGLRWYFTGGDAPILLGEIEWDCRQVPDLVLDGLRLSLLQGPSP